ncbi:hypothetical protein [Methylobacterium sp. AMS5]|uniref:hypothetical protein n=1 Tax=Methylobacterium sp. AMS5 TaxID=925818 RepID=UPI00074FA562|nr:hypothetical protein [Methylobacterium sp. AMS5]AMB48243.1 hypothetical protein Y590_25075 [Methylobacterium sp. AMS5]
MSYTIIDHGIWERYVPDEPPAGAPPSAMFARRVSDSLDWYVFARNSKSWTEGSLKGVLMPTEDGLLVQSIVRDPSLLFPQAGHTLIEILGYEGDEDRPHKPFEQKLCDIGTGTFRERPAPKVRQVSAAQAKTALFNAGLIGHAFAAVKGHPYPPVEIYWDSATFWEISNPYVQAIAEELNLNPTQLQALFDQASKL